MTIKQIAEQLIEARKKVLFRGKLRVDKDGDLIGDARSGVPGSVHVVASSSLEYVLMEENAEFFALAANHVTRLAEAAIRLADMVKSRCYCEDLRYHGNNGPCSCCKLLTEIERESP